jgi:hypothetical protein
MSNPNIVLSVGDEAMLIWRTALEFLEEHKFDTNLQFPKLLEDVAKKLNITDDSEKKELDAQIRFFVRRNPTYKAKRGAHGGIALASAEAQREAAKVARVQAKADAAARVEAALATAATATTPAPADEPEEDDLEIETTNAG